MMFSLLSSAQWKLIRTPLRGLRRTLLRVPAQRVEVIQQWPPSGILPRAHPVGVGAVEPAVRAHQTMAFCCKQSQGSLPGALSLSLSLPFTARCPACRL
ncbi:hypothetical protein CHARACLAT_008999 [Characodon lateralis]|uniref:Uncharacterized protein n=1 Tax=Characodon lateralis TaxID=208331 RepID=A0ABU7DFE6_9TELE|nr:hypothetical protein [Characodon lateralis]